MRASWHHLLGILCVWAPVRLCAQFTVERVAPGIYATIRSEPPGQAFESNSVFIVGDSGVIVVDAQSNLPATREVLAALRRITRKPVTALILTHWHFDHITGAGVYRDSFPGVAIIAHTRTQEAIDTGGPGRRSFLESLPQAKAYFQEMLDAGKSFDGAPLDEEERASISSDLRMADRYATTPVDFVPVTPTQLFTDRLTLQQGRRTIDLLYLGRGHTAGDIVVHLPEERILITGDLVTAPTPLVGTTSFPHEFAGTLDRLVALHPRVIIPGHGPVLQGDTYLRQETTLLHALVGQTDSLVALGDTLDQVRAAVDLRPFRTQFAGTSKVRRMLFYSYVTMPGVERAYVEAVAARGPHLIRASIPSGTRDVPQGEQELSFTCDGPVVDDAIWEREGTLLLPLILDHHWSDDRRTLTLRVRLAPGREFGIHLRPGNSSYRLHTAPAE
jgi:glyoxylase-like metal-dependent hydrolase (beta-lactamase superfamily II)